MKRQGNIYDKICSVENLLLADKKARKGKSWRKDIIEFDLNHEANIRALHEELINRTYTVSPYKTFPIYEPKERIVYCLPYRDRIVQHAILNIVEKTFVATYTADTYSCIKGRGIHSASANLKRVLCDRKGTEYCLKLDITKFYPSVDHDILKALLRRKFKDADFLWLMDTIIDSADGLPIGNYLSQYLANFYLCYFDHWLKQEQEVKYYFRYADDIIILFGDKQHLQKLLASIKVYLRDNLKLSVKDNYQVFPVSARGIDFLGYVFFHSHTRIRKSIKQACARKLAKNRNTTSVASYYGWLKHCDARHLMKKLGIYEDIKSFNNNQKRNNDDHEFHGRNIHVQ